MATANNALDRVKERLKVRGDTFLDSDVTCLNPIAYVKLETRGRHG